MINLLFIFIQLNIERDAGRVFSGFKEGKIVFAPTYKYSHNSDSYAGETVKSKKKRRTPAWYFKSLFLLFNNFCFNPISHAQRSKNLRYINQKP